MPVETKENVKVISGEVNRFGDSQDARRPDFSNYTFLEVGDATFRKVGVPNALNVFLKESVGKQAKIYTTPKNEVVGVVLDEGKAYFHEVAGNAWGKMFLWIVVALVAFVALSLAIGGPLMIIVLGLMAMVVGGVVIALLGFVGGSAIGTAMFRRRYKKAVAALKEDYPNAQPV